MKKLLTFFLFFFMLLGFLVLFPTVFVSATTYNISLENFDTYAEGVTSGTNGYLSWVSKGVNPLITSTTLKVSSPNSVKIRMRASEDSHTYFNLTDSVSINYFEFKLDDVYSTGVGIAPLYFYLYNSTTNFVSFRLENDYMYIYDYDAWVMLANVPLSGSGWYTFGFQGNHTASNPVNYVYYYMKNATGVLKGQLEKRWISLSDYENQSLSRIKIFLDCDGVGSSLLIKAYIDDITIGSSDAFGSSGFAYDTGYVIRCMNDGSESTTSMHELLSDCNIDWGCGIVSYFSLSDLQDCSDCIITYNPTRYIEYQTQYKYNEIIHDVFLPIGRGQYTYVSSNPNDYSMTINGVDCGIADYIINYGSYGDYALVWKDVDKLVNDEQVLFSFKSDKTTTIFSKDYYWWDMFLTFGGSGDTRVHNNINSYLNSNLDGQVWGNMELYLCWSFNESTIVDPHKPDNTELINLNYFDNYFGQGDNDSGYMEFYNFDKICGYNTGQSPIILFNLTGYINNTKIKYYSYTIYRQNGVSGVLVDTDTIEVIGNYRKGVIRDTFLFSLSGKYYIMVYNSTSDGMTLNNFTHRSENVGVCDAVIQPIQPITNQYGNYRSIIALIVMMGFILFPVILFRTNQFFINNGTIVVSLMGIIGLGFCIGFNLIDLWFAFLIGLVTCGILTLKIYQLMMEKRGE